MKALIIVLAVFSLQGCGWFGGGTKPSPLVTSECPDLTALRDGTFEATTTKLKEVADQYYLCRKAAIGEKK